MNILIFGATGMVGQGVLRECLSASDVEHVETIGRAATGLKHSKLREITHSNLLNCSSIETDLQNFDACFFCLGISSAGMTEAEYSHLTYDITLAAAQVLVRLNPNMIFTYVSGAGTDSSEKGRTMWARVKGKTENALLRLPFKAVYLFRPGIIQPLNGARSKTASYRWFYFVAKPFFPILRAIMPKAILTTESMGQAMLNAARTGAPKNVLEVADIIALSK
jgi:uncharacterized protein YbjT (DUF2867 family)